jgi:hypothetical protein
MLEKKNVNKNIVLGQDKFMIANIRRGCKFTSSSFTSFFYGVIFSLSTSTRR